MSREGRYDTQDRQKAWASGHAEARREDWRLDILYGKDRAKCPICGGRMDGAGLVRRCVYCGKAVEA